MQGLSRGHVDLFSAGQDATWGVLSGGIQKVSHSFPTCIGRLAGIGSAGFITEQWQMSSRGGCRIGGIVNAEC